MGRLNVFLTYLGLPPVARSLAVNGIHEYKEDNDGYVFRREYPRLPSHPNSGSQGTRWTCLNRDEVCPYVKVQLAKRN